MCKEFCGLLVVHRCSWVCYRSHWLSVPKSIWFRAHKGTGTQIGGNLSRSLSATCEKRNGTHFYTLRTPVLAHVSPHFLLMKLCFSNPVLIFPYQIFALFLGLQMECNVLTSMLSQTHLHKVSHCWTCQTRTKWQDWKGQEKVHPSGQTHKEPRLEFLRRSLPQRYLFIRLGIETAIKVLQNGDRLSVKMSIGVYTQFNNPKSVKLLIRVQTTFAKSSFLSLWLALCKQFLRRHATCLSTFLFISHRFAQNCSMLWGLYTCIFTFPDVPCYSEQLSGGQKVCLTKRLICGFQDVSSMWIHTELSNFQMFWKKKIVFGQQCQPFLVWQAVYTCMRF